MIKETKLTPFRDLPQFRKIRSIHSNRGVDKSNIQQIVLFHLFDLQGVPDEIGAVNSI